MKAKYYPHVTVLGAAVMFIAPLCFVLSLPYLRSLDETMDAELADAIINSAIEDHQKIAAAAVPKTEAAPVDESAHSTRVAMLAPGPAEPAAAMEYAMPEPRALLVDDASAVTDMAAIEDDKTEDAVPSSESDVPLPLLADSSDSSVTPQIAAAVQTTPSMAANAEMVDDDDDVFVEPKVAAGSHFDATAHLAMRSGGPGSTAAEVPKADSAKRVTDDRSGRRMSKSQERKMQAEKTAATDAIPKDGGFGVSPEAGFEEVILQQPLESRTVARMENVVAVTRAEGWPIALVRSDLPDDHWWVQQMVGIRGNAFAARVNFGNEDSIRGSVYHLIFVFLDSPDEVRRFRIAKQFKELPEGIRRSREYTFTRN